MSTLHDNFRESLKREYVGRKVRRFTDLNEHGEPVIGTVSDVYCKEQDIFVKIEYDSGLTQTVPFLGLINYRFAEEPVTEMERKFADILIRR